MELVQYFLSEDLADPVLLQLKTNVQQVQNAQSLSNRHIILVLTKTLWNIVIVEILVIQEVNYRWAVICWRFKWTGALFSLIRLLESGLEVELIRPNHC